MSLILHRSPLIGIGGVGLQTGNARPKLGELYIQGDKVPLIVWNILLRVDGIHGALGNTNRAVDALIGVDDEKIWALSEAVNRAHIDAVGVAALDARFCNNVGHGSERGSRPRKWLII